MKLKNGSRNAQFRGTLADIIADAVSEVETLREEMQEWHDNLASNNMEHLPKYDEVGECVDALSIVLDGELDGVDIPNSACGLLVSYTQDTRKAASSRAARLDNAARLLDAAADALMNAAGAVDDDVCADLEDDSGAMMELHDQLRDWYDQLQDISFPGMF